MKPALPPLPELDAVRHNPQPAPELRHGDLVGPVEALLHLAHPALELRAAVVAVGSLRLQHLALAARPGADAASACPRRVVRLALLAGHALDAALDVDLALQGLPEEEQGGARVGGDVGGLARGAEVGVDDEAPRVQLLEVDGARRDAARRQRRRGQRASLRVRDARAGLVGLREPGVVLRDGRGVKVGADERALCELIGLPVGVGTRGGD